MSPLDPPDQAGEGPVPHARPAMLARDMGPLGALLITLSNLSPSIGVFVVGAEVMREAGAATPLCFLLAALLGLPIANVYAELASRTPEAGGEYTIAGQALGPGWGFAMLGLNILTFSIAPAMTALGVAGYLQAVWPTLPTVPAAAVMVALCTGVAILNIRVNAWVTGVFLLLELASLGLVAALGALHARPDALARLLHPLSAAGSHPISAATLGLGVAGAIYAFDGYGSVVYLGEEVREAPRRMAPVVFAALAIAALFQLAPLVAVEAAAAAPQALYGSAQPVLLFVRELAGPALSQAMSVAVGLALFNAMIASAVMGGRQIYSSGRDRAWPPRLSRAFAAIHPRFASPWIATAVLGASGMLWCLVRLQDLVVLIGDGTAGLYACMCLAALRRPGGVDPGGYRMPFYPWTPVLGLVALGAVATLDLFDPEGRAGVAASLVTVALALGYYRFVVKPGGVWAHRGPGADSPTQAAALRPQA